MDILLAMLKLKIILILVVRRFAFKEGYDELARRKGKKATEVMRIPEWGNKACLVSLASSKPKDGIPVWIAEENVK
jgi:hypothetical protein